MSKSGKLDFQPMDKMAWVKGKELIPKVELDMRLVELHRAEQERNGMKGTRVSFMTYGILRTSMIRALVVSDDVISRMIKGAMPT